MEKSEKTASTCFRDLVPFCLWYDADPTLPLGYFEKPGSWPVTFLVLWIWGRMLGLGNMRMSMSMKIRGLALYQYPGIEGVAQGGAGRAGGGSEKLRRGEGWGGGLKYLG